MAKRHKRILVILAAQPFQKEHIPKRAHSKKGTFSIPKRAHSKKGTFQKGHTHKRAHFVQQSCELLVTLDRVQS